MIEFQVNERRARVDVAPMASLASVLREQLALTGTKVGCEEGFCGSCTILLDGQPVAACLLPVAHAAGRTVRTVEGLASNARLSPLQQALETADAVQCGMCFPGIVMSLTALLQRAPHPTRPQVHDALVGNICRCTGYERVVSAVLQLANGDLSEAQG
jgi:aerobic carbon-monoxide dehydrogenase small subunit